MGNCLCYGFYGDGLGGIYFFTGGCSAVVVVSFSQSIKLFLIEICYWFLEMRFGAY